MVQTRLLSAAALAAVLTTTACGGGGTGGFPAAQLTTASGIAAFDTASAPDIYLSTFAITGGVSSTTADPTCPSVVTNGATKTYTGGCTDMSGVQWFGSATVTSADATRPASVMLDGYGSTSATTCGGAATTTHQVSTGTIHTTADADGTVHFDIDVTYQFDRPAMSGCALQSGSGAIQYSGTYVASGPDTNMDGTPDLTTWNGSGQVGNSLDGSVTTRTSDETYDSVTCSTEALSGTTTLTSAGHTAVVTYDGATDCSTASTVTWTLDGAAQGTLSGVACSAGRAAGSARGAAGALVLLLPFTRMRRRSRARGRPSAPIKPRSR